MEQVRQLLRVAARLSGAATEQEVADIVLVEGASALDAATGAIWRVDVDALILVGAYNYEPVARAAVERLALSSDRPIADAALRHAAVWIESRADYAARYPASAKRMTPHIHAELAVACLPLAREDEVFGVIAFAFAGARRFDDAERTFVELLAQNCAQGLERARLYDVERGARRRAEAARERAAFLSKASALLAASLDYETTLRSVAALAVPRIADWCGIEMVTGPGATEQVAVAHTDPAKVQLARDLRRRYPPEPGGGVDEVIRTGVSQMMNDIPDALIAASAKNEEHLALLRAVGVCAGLTVPIRAPGEILGAITFVSSDRARRYTQDDLEMAEELGVRAGLAIASAQIYEAERRARDALGRLQEATAAFASARTVADVGAVAVELAAQVGADRVMVWGCDAEERVLHLVAERGLPDELRRELERVSFDTATPIGRVARSREPFFTEESHAPAPGTAQVLAGSAIPLLVQDRLVGVLGLAYYHPRGFADEDRAFLRSVADQCAQAVDRVRAYDEAVKAVALRDDFLSVAGHELRTPLTALHLQLSSLAGLAVDEPLPAKLADRAQKTVRQSERLARLVDELLDVSRIAQGRLTLDLDDVDLADVVGEAVARLDHEFRRLDTETRVRLVTVRGRWDAMRLEQVVTNLLTNALKYGAGRPVDVALELDAARAAAVLTVEDHGIGIDRAAQERIFGRFERAVSSRHYGGLGLGLWITRQIVEAHGGSIAVASEAGAGARFRVELPTRGPIDG